MGEMVAAAVADAAAFLDSAHPAAKGPRWTAPFLPTVCAAFFHRNPTAKRRLSPLGSVRSMKAQLVHTAGFLPS